MTEEGELKSAGEAIAIAPERAARVLVIDDELAGMTFSHLTDLTKNIGEVLGDLSSPELEALWAIVRQVRGFSSIEEEGAKKVLSYVNSDALIQEVLLSSHFRQSAPPMLMDPLSGFFERADLVATLKSQIETAFPAPAFETTFTGERPSKSAELLNYDLLILDLVLHKSAGAVDEIVTYLKKMGDTSYPAALPCIIVMSSRVELHEQRLRFSTESNISAAGLLLVPKAEISREDFGTEGLSLCYQQLNRQRKVAQDMRVFMRTWMNALEKAREHANVALWNLDAAAMQEIHLSAFQDNDPYDEHLNELMAREYLWHVESSPAVSEAIESLDSCFQEQFKKGVNPPVIGQRFIAPFVKPKAGRDLVSHFTWTGFTVPGAFYPLAPDKALGSFNRLVPFGAVLAPPVLTPDTECLVHITQQCDLNAATRPEKLANPVQSAQFAIVLPVEVVEHRMPSHGTEELVARGLMIGDKEYDFKLAKGRQLAMPIRKFIEYATSEKLKVIGRLRHDIATHFLSATANHMTRFASLKTTRVEVRTARIFLYGKRFPDRRPIPFLDSEGKEPLVVQMAKHNKLHFFQDETSMRIALWIGRQLVEHYAATNIDASETCNALSVGLSNKQCLVKQVDFYCEAFPIEEINARLSPDHAPDPRVRLMVVEEP